MVPETHNGTCPCCLKQHRATKRGVVTRHGWQETGRQVGSFGQGFQWGECAGWGKLPLETTDADALEILETLTERMGKLQKEIHRHTDGAESYTESINLTDNRNLEGYEAAINRLGLSFQRQTQSIKRQGIRVFYETVEVFTVTVTRGFSEAKVTQSDVGGWGSYLAFSVRSWESLRQGFLRGLQTTLEAMETQYKRIQAAVVYHRDNPSNGVPVAVEAPTVHFRRELERSGRKVTRIACGAKVSSLSTTVVKEITCKRCLNKKVLDSLPD